MALDNAAPLEPAIAHILVAPPNTAAPTEAAVSALSASNPTLASWANFGHTSLENDLAPFRDGGDATVRGSRQNPALRETVAAIVLGVDISAIQVSSDTLNYFYGGGIAAEGGFTIPDTSAPIQKAVLVVYFDGAEVVAEYHSLASIRGNGPLRNAAAGWLEFPIRMTWLKGTNADKWIGDRFDVLA